LRLETSFEHVRASGKTLSHHVRRLHWTKQEIAAVYRIQT
jgi:hypothetical protein